MKFVERNHGVSSREGAPRSRGGREQQVSLPFGNRYASGAENGGWLWPTLWHMHL
ncbi:hypothetical protein RGUI_1518 [Rhodovulum sp. P5]|nr:hypothetical protein RGUI_1518 [Rhodovulum sp. P5]